MKIINKNLFQYPQQPDPVLLCCELLSKLMLFFIYCFLFTLVFSSYLTSSDVTVIKESLTCYAVFAEVSKNIIPFYFAKD